MADYKQILFDTQGRTGVITLNRPERLNAFTYDMLAEFYDAIARCNDDDGIGAIVFTGAGRGFCSGADIGGFAGAINAREQGDEDAARRRVADRAGRESLSAYFRKAKPIIAAINGPAIGVGLTMTLNMDLRIASESARFSMRFVRLGITPEAGSTLYLPQIVGLPNALELALTGRIIDAQEALAKGLVSKVVPDAELMPAALALAEEIAFNPTEQVLAAKQMIHRHMVEQDIDHLLTYENKIFGAATAGPNHKEAIRAYVEKRPPNFHPRS